MSKSFHKGRNQGCSDGRCQREEQEDVTVASPPGLCWCKALEVKWIPTSQDALHNLSAVRVDISDCSAPAPKSCLCATSMACMLSY
ncbi:hypothetical protein F7725_020898 [Dissostichus mawsoni]|uniref:Uncharacterized protein n=1 Tax=Dissostichus mawsoni TaxID=36200 RepID=A0A7J5YEL8_DISMA|nr:hypothetical protein F7725_020898 [Dissostichus mawsoni]